MIAAASYRAAAQAALYSPLVTAERPESFPPPQEIVAVQTALVPEPDELIANEIRRIADMTDVELTRDGQTRTVAVAALVSDTHIGFLLRWRDESPDTTHRDWIWRDNRYVEEDRFEDAATLRFGVGCDFVAKLDAGVSYDADLWYWGAARTNPVGFAADMSLFVDFRPLREDERTFVYRFDVKNQNPFWRIHEGWQGSSSPMYLLEQPRPEVYAQLKYDVGDPVYLEREKPGAYEGDRVARFIPGEPTRSSADIKALGVWSDGWWTVALKRRRITPFRGDDWSVVPLVTMGISVLDSSEFPDEYVSDTLLFRIEDPNVARSE